MDERLKFVARLLQQPVAMFHRLSLQRKAQCIGVQVTEAISGDPGVVHRL